MWTRQELEETFPCAEERYFDILFARRTKVTLTNIVNARSIPKKARQYGIWELNHGLWSRALEGNQIDTTDGWRKFAQAVRALDADQTVDLVPLDK